MRRRFRPVEKRIISAAIKAGPEALRAKPLPEAKVPDREIRETVNRIIQRQNKRVLTRQQLTNFLENAKRKWTHVHSVEQLAALQSKSNYLRVCVEEEQKLRAAYKQGDPTVKEKYEHAKKVLDLYRDPEVVFILYHYTKGGFNFILLTGPKATPRKIFSTIQSRMLVSEEEAFSEAYHRAFELREAGNARRQFQQWQRNGPKDPKHYKIDHYRMDPVTKKFTPIYVPRWLVVHYEAGGLIAGGKSNQ